MACKISNRLLVIRINNDSATMTDVQHDVHRFMRHSPHGAISRQPNNVFIVAVEYRAVHIEIFIEHTAFHRGQPRRLFFINYDPNIRAVNRNSEFYMFHAGRLQMCLSDGLKISHR
ncbi:hypothetical protein PF619_gp12 [Salmonella phage GRNsp27]|uniref:Uncharacterized protein n=1 Tax=Salmonella phage GRNsp27 TaxID=2959429 RepID=A0A9E7N0Z9_9CAUD|nr:hypothetical protein PF619_gp12 [Salmonella phage GRNsp27]USW07546.1 hypothetical protein [Salmonella phage GRNsp27]